MPINNKSGTQPGLCSPDFGLCVANLHVDSTTACLVPSAAEKDCGDAALATVGELRPVLGCGPSHPTLVTQKPPHKRDTQTTDYNMANKASSR